MAINPPTPPLPHKLSPEVRKIWWITFVVQSTFGLTKGLYIYIWGPYFYEKFGGSIQPSTAMLLTTVLLGVRQGLIALLEVPTGAFADTIGRAHTVILSWIIRVLFFVCLAAIWFCDSAGFAFMWAVLASITFALSYTFFNGAFSAWCADTLREKAPDVTYGWLASRFYSYHCFFTAVGGVIGVLFYIKGIAFASFLLAAFLSFCAVGFCMAKMDEVRSLHFIRAKQVQFSTITRRIGEIIGRGAQLCGKTPVLFWIILTQGSYLFLLNLVEYLWPVYLKTKFGSGDTLLRDWILIVVAAQLLSTGSSRLLVWLNKRWTAKGGVKGHLVGFRRFFIGSALASAIATLVLSWDTAYPSINLYIFPISVLVVILACGIMLPSFETLINSHIPVEEAQHRATITSAGSMFRSFLVLILAVPSGGASGETSPISWAIPATLLLVSTLIANVFMRRAALAKEGVEPVVLPTPAKG